MKPWMNRISKKTLAAVGTAVGIVTVFVCTFAAVQMCWLTPGEQSAARSALAMTDELRQAPVSGEDTDAKVRQAEDAVETARQSARTARDQKVAVALMQYLSSIETQREAMRSPGFGQIDSLAVMGVQPAASVHLVETASSRSLSLQLHQTLD